MQLPSVLVGLDLTLEDLPEIDASDPFKNFDRKRVLRGASILSGTVEFDTSTLIERFDLLVDYLLEGKINSALRLKIFNQFQKIPIHLKTKWLFHFGIITRISNDIIWHKLERLYQEQFNRCCRHMVSTIF